MILRLPPIVLVLIALGCGVVAALVALQKRRNPGLWFLLGLLIPVVGLAIVAVLPPAGAAPGLTEGDPVRSLPDDETARRYEPREGTTYCHHCGAPNPSDATFCKNCGEMLRM